MTKPIVLITGANGFISKHLAKQLSDKYSVRFLTRNVKNANEYFWNIKKNEIDETALDGVSHIIHLAGATISERRWTASYKQEIISSRVNSAKLLLSALKRTNKRVETFVTASGIGYYGSETSSKIFAEYDAKGTDFLSDVVWEWEQIADEFRLEEVADRVVKLRTGVVLSEEGGALPKMILSMKFRVGVILGTGNQYVAYISLRDICRMYQFALENPVEGVFNACVDNFLTYSELLKHIASTKTKPFFYIKIPAFLVRLILGESSVIILKGNRISSKKIKQVGFSFLDAF